LAWTRATNMLFVEQPAGTGFSWGPTPQTEQDLSMDFYNFLINFYKVFPHYQTKRLYLFGESYAGYYVPSIAHQIHLENKKNKQQQQLLQVPLAGIGIGNGWMDAVAQGPVVIDYAWWHGLIDSTTKEILWKWWQVCQDKSKSATSTSTTTSSRTIPPLPPPLHEFTIPDECNIMGAVLEAAGAGIFPVKSPNQYDVTTWDTYPGVFATNSTYRTFLNNPKVKQALHAPIDTEWWGCIPGAGRRRSRQRQRNLLDPAAMEEQQQQQQPLLAHDKPDSVVPYLAELLDDAGIQVLIYNGDRDMSVCAQGSELLLDGMEWNGASQWKTAPRGLWIVNNDVVAGYAKSHGNLTFVIVSNSGHLVPHNVPVPALDLITRVVTHKSFLDKKLVSFDNLVQKMKKKNDHDYYLTNENENAQHKHGFYVEVILVVGVAIACFVAGMFVFPLLHRRITTAK
jgi:carboxypeptidase C (cathepsin A)